MKSAASSYAVRSYDESSCSGSFYNSSYPTGTNCTVSYKGTAAQYYQATYCSTLTPTAIPTTSPTGPSYKPTPQPTSAPTKSPTALPSVVGAINAGYIVYTSYSDLNCSNVSSITLYRLGACIVDPPYSSYKILNYEAKQSFATVVYYSDAKCGVVDYMESSNSTKRSSTNCVGNSLGYSASLPVFPTSGVITA